MDQGSSAVVQTPISTSLLWVRLGEVLGLCTRLHGFASVELPGLRTQTEPQTQSPRSPVYTAPWPSSWPVNLHEVGRAAENTA